MSKTQWPAVAPFSHLTPTLMEAYWGTNAATGHNHEGTDDDGSCPKIDLVAATDMPTGAVDSEVRTSALTVQQDFELNYYRVGSLVHVFIPSTFGTSNSGTLKIYPATTWPSAMVGTDTMSIINGWDNGSKEFLIIQPPTSTSDTFDITRISASFTAAGQKGFDLCNLCYVAA